MSDWKIEINRPLGIVVRCKAKEPGYAMDFEVYEAWAVIFKDGPNASSRAVMDLDELGEEDAVIGLQAARSAGFGHPHPLKPLPDGSLPFSDAQVHLSGHVKWDGCSDISFDEARYHFCGVEDSKRVSEILVWLYSLAKRELGEHALADFYDDIPDLDAVH